jgi:hypothetical protein
MLRAFIPYFPGDLGRAYNECMASLPESGWAALVDHDAMFGHPHWHKMISESTSPTGWIQTGFLSFSG